MCDLSTVLMPRTYPEAFALVHGSFAAQPDYRTCGAAALRHGLLLGGLLAPVNLLENLLEIRNNRGTDYKILLKILDRLGFKTEPEPRKKPKEKSTAAFLDELCLELEQEQEQGAFFLPCRNGGHHWVCLGAWDRQRAWVIDSCYGYEGRLDISGYTEQEFDDTEWEGYINVVRPGKWADQYKAWLPARPALLRMKDRACPVTMEAAVRNAAQQYLNDAEYSSYRELGLYLQGGVEVTVKVKNPGQDAVLVGEEGVGGDRVLVFRRVSGSLRGQTPPKLVLRAGRLRAAQLG
jgi:hypothetical protein